ncbi:MAG: DUF1134 domain-containing protein [Pseudomonadota bacterium]
MARIRPFLQQLSRLRGVTGRLFDLATPALAVAAVVAFTSVPLSLPAYAEDLPWLTDGTRSGAQPDVITPSTTYDPGPVDPDEDYDTSRPLDDDEVYAPRRRAPDNRADRSADRYQQDPDYSTYQPAAPDPTWQDDDLGVPQRARRAPRRRTAAPTPGTVAPPPADYRSRFDGTFSADEIVQAGHIAFGQVARGFASVVEHVFRKQGRPNGYIIGQEAGGAVVAGLRYGEGVLYTKNAGTHPIYWQGPSVGYDFGAEGSKTMILVYHLRDTGDAYGRFGGVDGSAYLVGGVGVTFQQKDHVLMAPIRSGVGLRLGANIGYLKYSRVPTWNPF